jgi:membrane-anchored protein YejM (alkaline phosphatase superfamily)
VALFSILTSLDPSYWAAENTALSPVGLRAFASLGYEIKYKSGASLSHGVQTKVLPGGQADVVPTPDLSPVLRDDLNAEWAAAWLTQPHDRPRFAILFLDASHFPYWTHDEAPHPLLLGCLSQPETLRHQQYLRSVREVDGRIGRVVQALRDGGKYHSTAVVVTGDHGEAFGEHGMFCHGVRLDDEQINVPLIMHLPGGGHRRIDRLTVHQDILPTLLSFLGASPLLLGLGRGVDSGSPGVRPAPPLVAICGVRGPVGYAALFDQQKLVMQIDRHGAELVNILGPGGVSEQIETEQIDEAVKAEFSAATALLAATVR